MWHVLEICTTQSSAQHRCYLEISSLYYNFIFPPLNIPINNSNEDIAQLILSPVIWKINFKYSLNVYFLWIFNYFHNFLNQNTPNHPIDTGRKLNVHKTFRRRLLNVLCTFNLRPVSTGQFKITCVCVYLHGFELFLPDRGG